MVEIFSLEGKRAFVSGASRGLGREMALTLAEAGAEVALAARTVGALEETAETIRTMGRKALVCPMDISNIDDIQKAVGDAVKALGRIDILINNAGIAEEKPVIEMTAETWDRVMNVNLRGHVFCTKAVGKYMIENRYGKVLNIASILGLVGVAYNSPYAASKGGLIKFTKSLALEWARYNIQVNALCPGVTLGERMTTIVREKARIRGVSVEEIERAYTEDMALKRWLKPTEMAAAAVFLASDDSSAITGQAYAVDGGFFV